MDKWSKLAPLTIQEQEDIAKLAIHFFSFSNNAKLCKEFKSRENRAFSAGEFLTWCLHHDKKYKDINKKFQRVYELINVLCNKGLLVEAGTSQIGPFSEKRYFFY